MATQTIIQVANPVKGGLGWGGIAWPEKNSLLWAGLFGSDWPNNDDLFDQSLRYQRATRVGNPVRGVQSIAPQSSDHYLQLPYTDTDLINRGVAGECSVCALVKSNSADGVVFSTLTTSAISHIRLYMSASGTLVAGVDKGSEAQQTLNLSRSPASGAWEFVGVTFAASGIHLYRRNATDADMLTANAALTISGIEGAGSAPRIGANISAIGVAGGFEIGAIAFYDKALNAGDMDDCYSTIKATAAEHTAIAI